MKQTEMIKKIEELNEWTEILEGAKAQVQAIKDTIKEEMENLDAEELECGQYIIRYTSVLTSKFNVKGFKESHEDMYLAYLKQVSSKRFSISC